MNILRSQWKNILTFTIIIEKCQISEHVWDRLFNGLPLLLLWFAFKQTFPKQSTWMGLNLVLGYILCFSLLFLVHFGVRNKDLHMSPWLAWAIWNNKTEAFHHLRGVIPPPPCTHAHAYIFACPLARGILSPCLTYIKIINNDSLTRVGCEGQFWQRYLR